MDPHQNNLEQKIAERFAQLPKPVQDAITSAEVQENLRKLSDAHKLHLDQWQIFENEVFFAILGFQRVEDLEQNIVAHVGIPADMARQLAVDVNAVIFEPIREELERTLEHPSAQPEETSGAEAVRTQVLDAAAESGAPTSPPTTPTVQSATPPSPAPDIKVTRPSEGTAYRPGEASHARTTIVDDPYREPVA